MCVRKLEYQPEIYMLAERNSSYLTALVSRNWQVVTASLLYAGE